MDEPTGTLFFIPEHIGDDDANAVVFAQTYKQARAMAQAQWGEFNQHCNTCPLCKNLTYGPAY